MTTAQSTQPAQSDAQPGMQGNPANVVRLTGIRHCAACGDATHYDPQTGTHDKTWCAVCYPRPEVDQVPF